VSSYVVEHARQQWQDGHLRVERVARGAAQPEQLWGEVETVLDALRRRVGERFTLAGLAAAYDGAEDWARELIGETDPPPGWERNVAIVTDAAFHLYSRAAADYRP
jgi:hypothetical protein